MKNGIESISLINTPRLATDCPQGSGWSRSLDLPPGLHQYKYIVDGEWLHDPSKPCQEDGKGNVNNVISVEQVLILILII